MAPCRLRCCSSLRGAIVGAVTSATGPQRLEGGARGHRNVVGDKVRHAQIMRKSLRKRQTLISLRQVSAMAIFVRLRSKPVLLPLWFTLVAWSAAGFLQNDISAVVSLDGEDNERLAGANGGCLYIFKHGPSPTKLFVRVCSAALLLWPRGKARSWPPEKSNLLLWSSDREGSRLGARKSVKRIGGYG